MTKLQTHWHGGAMDDRFPQDRVRALLSAHPTVADDFCEWFGPELGAYRFNKQARENALSRSKEIEALKSIQTVLGDAALVFSPGALPVTAAAVVRDKLFGIGRKNLEALNEAARQHAYRLQAAVRATILDFEKIAPAPGRPRSFNRDVLFQKIVARLRVGGIRAAAAHQLADTVLKLCDVSSPGEDVRAVRRALKSGQK